MTWRCSGTTTRSRAAWLLSPGARWRYSAWRQRWRRGLSSAISRSSCAWAGASGSSATQATFSSWAGTTWRTCLPLLRLRAWLARTSTQCGTSFSSFRGVEHRLEPVREIDGVAYYNDSIATSPERAAAALRSFAQPIVLLAGGQDKHLPWDDLANLMLQKTRAVVLFGQAANLIDRALDRRPRQEPGAIRRNAGRAPGRYVGRGGRHRSSPGAAW